MMPPNQLKKKKINIGHFKYVEFWRMGMCKDEPMLKNLVHTWIIGITFLSYCQNLCQLKVQPSWKVFGLQTIKDLIKCKMSFTPIVDVDH
jgi:hypothetical protein